MPFCGSGTFEANRRTGGKAVDISFKSVKLRKAFESERSLKKEYGQLSKAILARIALFESVQCLNDVPIQKPARRHQLTGDRDELYAVDLGRLYRLVFEVDNEPVPRKDDGGIDLKQVTAVKIMEVVDYH